MQKPVLAFQASSIYREGKKLVCLTIIGASCFSIRISRYAAKKKKTVEKEEMGIFSELIERVMSLGGGGGRSILWVINALPMASF